MNVVLTDQAIDALTDVPAAVKKAFDKQLRFLVRDLRHPSLRAKKYDESKGLLKNLDELAKRDRRTYILYAGKRARSRL